MSRFMYKISRNVISKVLKPIYKYVLCLKAIVIVFNEFLRIFYSLDIFQINSPASNISKFMT